MKSCMTYNSDHLGSNMLEAFNKLRDKNYGTKGAIFLKWCIDTFHFR